ncbi:MAG TPA: MBL fold metallo-hydrolase [Candidatus Cybelea sp.]|nr:MBL fold metallo-hydrolase [Candidatus Cybelea sp.]
MAVQIPFRRDLVFEYGVADTLSPGIRRVIAKNPSHFTFHGTGTYIVGKGKVAVIDPGPDLPAHVDALLAALRGETVTHILITHTHIDHSPGAAAFKTATGAKTYGFGPHPRHKPGMVAEEGGDMGFVPDVVVQDGDVIEGQGWTMDALHTPGHISNHLCFALREEQVLFSGDHVMGWSTSVISPPDGDMGSYFASLKKLLPRQDRLYFPTHGSPIPDPQAYVRLFISHREDREAQILKCISDGVGTIPAMVEIMYRDVPQQLHRAAARSVLAHLIHMQRTGRVVAEGATGETAVYRLP